VGKKLLVVEPKILGPAGYKDGRGKERRTMGPASNYGCSEENMQLSGERRGEKKPTPYEKNAVTNAISQGGGPLGKGKG